MTLDVKALRARAEAGWDKTLTAEQQLALLDRLERAEAIVGAVEAAYYPAHGDDVERHWYRVRSLLDDARWRGGHARAALDDEAPR